MFLILFLTNFYRNFLPQLLLLLHTLLYYYIRPIDLIKN